MNDYVSINIPVYNAGKTIARTILSLLNQTHKKIIINIYDNCSTDNTLEILQLFQCARLKVFNSDLNLGWNKNFNKCLASHGCKFTLIAHSDDIYHPRFIETNLEIIKNKPKVGLCFSAGFLFKHDQEIEKRIKKTQSRQCRLVVYSSKEELLIALSKKGNFLFCPSAFGRTEVFSDVIREFNGKIFGGAADLDAWIRVAQNHHIAVIERPHLFYYRLSEQQLSEVDRKTHRNNLFVDCVKKHLSTTIISNELNRTELERNLDWYSILQEIEYDFTIPNHEISPITFFLNFNRRINLLLSVSSKKKFKLKFYLWVLTVAKMFPPKLASLSACMIKKYSR